MAAMLMRVFVPVGYMPDWSKPGILSVRICTFQGIKFIDADASGKFTHDGSKGSHQRENGTLGHTLCTLGASAAQAVGTSPIFAILTAAFFVLFSIGFVPFTLPQRRYFCDAAPRGPPIFS